MEKLEKLVKAIKKAEEYIFLIVRELPSMKEDWKRTLSNRTLSTLPLMMASMEENYGGVHEFINTKDGKHQIQIFWIPVSYTIK
jgi:hypothetical protein